MRYQWQNEESLIHDITFNGNGKKTIREAVIRIPENRQASEKERDLDNLFIDNGYTVSYDVQDEKPVLRVGGFRTERDILNLLEKEQIVTGQAQTSKVEQKKTSAWQTIRENSLVLSAVFYMAGNVATALSGLFRKDMDELRTGLSFSVGDGFMLMFGKTSDKEKHNHVMQGFGEFLSSHGYAPDVGSNFAQSAIKDASHSGFRKAMKSLVIPIKSMSEIFAGYSFARAGFNQENAYKKVAGTALMTGFGAGLLIPEMNKSEIRDALGVNTPEQAKQAYKDLSVWKKVKYAVMGQPLILAGGFAGINNLSTIFGAFDEKNNSRNLRKVEAELGVDTTNTLLTTPNSSYEVAILNYTKTKPVEKTAYAAYEELKEKLNNPQTLESERVKLRPQFQAASDKVDKLKEEYEIATEGRFGLKGDQFWKFNLVQGGLFLVANSLYGMSSKAGSGSNDLTERFVAAVSTEIVKNPDPVSRIDLMSLAAQYGGGLEEMDFTAAEVRGMIEERVEKLQTSPWAKKYLEDNSQKIVVEIDPNALAQHVQDKETQQVKEAPVETVTDKAAEQSALTTVTAQTEPKEQVVAETKTDAPAPSFTAKVTQQALEAEQAATASSRV